MTHPREYQEKRTAAVTALLENPEFASTCEQLREERKIRIVNRRQARKYLNGRGAVWSTRDDRRR